MASAKTREPSEPLVIPIGPALAVPVAYSLVTVMGAGVGVAAVVLASIIVCLPQAASITASRVAPARCPRVRSNGISLKEPRRALVDDDLTLLAGCQRIPVAWAAPGLRKCDRIAEYCKKR